MSDTLSRPLDVTHLPGLRPETRAHLRLLGITTLEQFVAFSPDDLRQFKGIKSTAPRIHATARAYMEQKPIWYNDLPPACSQCGFNFDLETDPATGVPWSWGWSNGEGEVNIILVVAGRQAEFRLPDGQEVTVAPTSDDAWRAFAEAVGDCDWPVYHWSGFDAGVLRATAPEDAKARLTHRMTDLLAAFNHCVRFPIPNSSLKTVAAYLAFSWSAYADWWQAYNDYRHWLRTGETHPLMRACSYQADDVKALALVWKWLNANQKRP
jgi:predicted RecB family nuclease